MKNLFKYVFMLMVVAMGVVSLTACSSSGDDDSSGIPSALVGTWNGTEGRYSSSVTFYSNGTFTHELNSSTGMTQQYAGTFTFSGTTVTCTGKMVRVDSDGTVTEGDRVITFTFDGTSLSGGAYTTMTYSKEADASSSDASGKTGSLIGWYYSPAEGGVLLQSGSYFQLSGSFSDPGFMTANRYMEVVNITSDTSMDVYTEVYEFLGSNSEATWANKWQSYSASIGTLRASSASAKKTYSYTRGTDRLTTSNGEYMLLSNGSLKKNGSSNTLTKK